MLINVVYLSDESMMKSIPSWVARLIDIFFNGYPLNMNILKKRSIQINNIDYVEQDEKSVYTRVSFKNGKWLLVVDSAEELHEKINKVQNGRKNNTGDEPGK